LTEAHLLPGALLRNSNMRFICDRVAVRVENVETPWTSFFEPHYGLTLPVAHNEGNYFADERTLAELEDEGRVVLRYVENPNGSANDIAGICSEGGNVVGLMPHPERASDPLLGSGEGLRVFESVLRFAGARA
jgi:phosphoribosylformylglycinamidine synthase subunit PurQ / glutaminase